VFFNFFNRPVFLRCAVSRLYLTEWRSEDLVRVFTQRDRGGVGGRFGLEATTQGGRSQSVPVAVLGAGFGGDWIGRCSRVADYDDGFVWFELELTEVQIGTAGD